MKGKLSLVLALCSIVSVLWRQAECRQPQNPEKMDEARAKTVAEWLAEQKNLAELIRAAGAGDPSAQCSLGNRYYLGQGVPRNNKEAARWFRKAAEQGHASAQFNLGALFSNGQGVEEDYVQAYVWFSLAAVAGLENAAKARDAIAQGMTPEQIAQARDLAAKWKPVKPKETPDIKSDAALSTGSLRGKTEGESARASRPITRTFPKNFS